MKLIVGLGNPGEKYKHNRHNSGFLALDFILNDNDGFMTAKPSHEFKSEIFTWLPDGDYGAHHGNGKVIFLKPQTFMNDSGQALKIICNFYKMDLAKDLLVIHDDVDLPFGEMRISKNASDAGHNGIKSIIENLGTQDFLRLRIGVETRDSREELPTEAFVLQNFSAEEIKTLETNIFPKIKEEVEIFIRS
jgi:peptidyl-tRNA hydrolase, PTH1 family